MNYNVNTFEYIFFKKPIIGDKPFFNSRIDFARLLAYYTYGEPTEEKALKIRRLIDASANRKKISPELKSRIELFVQVVNSSVRTEEYFDYFDRLELFSDTITESTISILVDECKSYLEILKEVNSSDGPLERNFYFANNRDVRIFKDYGCNVLSEQIGDFEHLESILKEEFFLPKNYRKLFRIYVALTEADLLDVDFLKNKLLHLLCQYEFRMEQTITFLFSEGLRETLRLDRDLMAYIQVLSGKLESVEKIYDQTGLKEYYIESLNFKYVLSEYKRITDLLRNKPNYDLKIGQIANRIKLACIDEKHFPETIEMIGTRGSKDLIDVFFELESYTEGASYYTNIAYNKGFLSGSTKINDLCRFFLQFAEINQLHDLNRTFTIPENYNEVFDTYTKKVFILFLKINLFAKVKVRIVLTDHNSNPWRSRNFIHIKPSIKDKENRSRLYVIYLDRINNIVIKEVKEAYIENDAVDSIINLANANPLTNNDISKWTERLQLSSADYDDVVCEYNYLISNTRLNLPLRSDTNS